MGLVFIRLFQTACIREHISCTLATTISNEFPPDSSDMVLEICCVHVSVVVLLNREGAVALSRDVRLMSL